MVLCSTDLSTASQWYYSQSDFQKICGTRTASYMLLGVGRRYYQYPSHKMQKICNLWNFLFLFMIVSDNSVVVRAKFGIAVRIECRRLPLLFAVYHIIKLLCLFNICLLEHCIESRWCFFLLTQIGVICFCDTRFHFVKGFIAHSASITANPYVHACMWSQLLSQRTRMCALSAVCALLSQALLVRLYSTSSHQVSERHSTFPLFTNAPGASSSR